MSAPSIYMLGSRVVGATSAVCSPGIGIPAFSAGFDSLTPGAGDGLNVQGGIVSNAQSYSAPNSSQATIAQGAFSAGFSQALPLTNQPAEGNEVWHRIRTFFPTGFSFQAPGGAHLKFLRIDTGLASSSGHGFHIDWYIFNGGVNAGGDFDWIYEGQNVWQFGGAGSTALPTGIVTGAWQTWERYELLSATAGTATSRLWRNGTLIYDTSANLPVGVTRLANLNTSYIVGGNNGTAQGFMNITYWNGGAPQAQSWYIDDLTIYTSLTGAPTSRDAAGNTYIGI
jgi:hypothetical protein